MALENKYFGTDFANALTPLQPVAHCYFVGIKCLHAVGGTPYITLLSMNQQLYRLQKHKF